MKTKPARFFSGPLMKQNIKSTWVLLIVICLVFSMITTVVTFAIDVMCGNGNESYGSVDYQTEFYKHLFVLATYNEMMNSNLSVDDFLVTEDRSVYDKVFSVANKLGNTPEAGNLSTDLFDHLIYILQDEKGSVDYHVEQFEYLYAMSDEKGVFTGRELDIKEMVNSMLSAMGISQDRLSIVFEMDMTTMLNTMYFTVMGLLPIFLFVVIVGNLLIVNQVDSGSMAYVLSTPTKRVAVANTQALFLIIAPLIICAVGCVVRCFGSIFFSGEKNIKMNIALYFGMYLLAEAVGGICYMGSCVFNQSRKSIAFGGGITVWFFLASLLGLFGSEDMINMGVGVEQLEIFNKLTLVGLYDIQALSTVGGEDVNYSFVWKLCVLGGVAVITYVIGNLRFQKKDLPL